MGLKLRAGAPQPGRWGHRRGWLSLPSSPGVTDIMALIAKQGMAEWGPQRTGDLEWNRKWSLWFNHRAFPECHLLRVTQRLGKVTVLRWGRGWAGGCSSYRPVPPQKLGSETGKESSLLQRFRPCGKMLTVVTLLLTGYFSEPLFPYQYNGNDNRVY